MKINVYDILRKHFPETEYALMSEVRNAAGFGASRSADYIAMNLWPSRGLSLHGIEQKSFRGDWTKELKTPEKADAIFKYCDYWWLFTTDDNIAKIEEIPEMWGWIRIHNGKIKIIKNAPKLTPCVMDRGFLACLLKRASSKDGFIRADSIQERIDKAKEDALNSKNHRVNKLESDYRELLLQFNEFRNYTGIDIGDVNSWRRPSMEKIGAAVNMLANGTSERLTTELVNLESSAERILNNIQKSISVLKETRENSNT